jgi:hypothetical protein
MVDCPKCNIHVNNFLLRSEEPRCGDGHKLGVWVRCKNTKERHVYLSLNDSKCQFCQAEAGERMVESVKVKCLHVTSEGTKCPTRPFLWMKEGPPCFMNHVGKMALE